jgi:MFS family permease
LIYINFRVICRAFQGLGGAGIYTLTLFSILRILPYEQYDRASSLAGGILSIGLVLGPLLGGAIANNGKWRWVFLLKYVHSFMLEFVAQFNLIPETAFQQVHLGGYCFSSLCRLISLTQHR